MVKQDDVKLSRSQKILSVLPPIIFILSNIFLFGPFTIYQGNVGEFGISFISIIKVFLLPSLILGSILSTLGISLSDKLHKRYVSVLFVLGLLFWIQGNVFVWKYGLFDGQGIDWTRARWRGWLDGALWLILLTSSFIFYKKYFKIVTTTSILIICLQIVFTGFSSIWKPDIWKSDFLGLNVTPKWVGEFSASKNVIHFILDAFQSDIFEEIIERDREDYSKALEGFTFFKEATGSFPTTYLSVPAILSGQVYQNDIPILDFFKQTLTGKTIPNVLYDKGYEVDLIPAIETYRQGKSTHSYLIPDPYIGTIQDYKHAKSALMIDLVLFRNMPHFIKRYIYRDQQWFIQKWFVQDTCMQFRHFGHEAFLRDIINTISPNRDKPVYKFYHFMTTHVPLLVNKDCECAGAVLPQTRENVFIQSKCSLDHFIEFLIKVKSLGIYDNSLIILQGDHGSVASVELGGQDDQSEGYDISSSVVASALPLMLIKPPGSNGPLRISKAPVMLSDVPATINSVLHLNDTFPGQSVFKILPEEIRERRYYDYRWKNSNWQSDYLPPLIEYTIIGSVFNRDSWQLGKQNPRAKNISFKTQEIDLGTDSATNYLRHGWGGNERSEQGLTYMWALGKSASVFLSLPKNKAVRMTANVNSVIFPKPQVVTIKVDGQIIGSWTLSNRWQWQEPNIIIEPSEKRPDVSIIEFLFSQQLMQKNDQRPLAVLFESITLDEQ